MLGLSLALLAGGSTVATAQDNATPNVEGLQLRLLTDDKFLDALYGLSGDPLVQDVLDDPDIQQAMRNGDRAALLQNPKLQRLAADPRVQGVTKELSK